MTALHTDDIIEDAVSRAGVADPDPDLFLPNLELLVSSINEEAGLTAGGVAATQAVPTLNA